MKKGCSVQICFFRSHTYGSLWWILLWLMFETLYLCYSVIFLFKGRINSVLHFIKSILEKHKELHWDAIWISEFWVLNRLIFLIYTCKRRIHFRSPSILWLLSRDNAYLLMCNYLFKKFIFYSIMIYKLNKNFKLRMMIYASSFRVYLVWEKSP